MLSTMNTLNLLHTHSHVSCSHLPMTLLFRCWGLPASTASKPLRLDSQGGETHSPNRSHFPQINCLEMGETIKSKGSHQLKKDGILWIKFIKRWPPRGVPLLWIPIFIFFCSIFDVKKTKFLGWKEDSQSPPWTLKAPLEPWKGN